MVVSRRDRLAIKGKNGMRKPDWFWLGVGRVRRGHVDCWQRQPQRFNRLRTDPAESSNSKAFRLLVLYGVLNAAVSSHACGLKPDRSDTDGNEWHAETTVLSRTCGLKPVKADSEGKDQHAKTSVPG